MFRQLLRITSATCVAMLAGAGLGAAAATASSTSTGAITPQMSTSCAPPGASLFGGGSWPPACWRPYGAESPFNLRLPRKPAVHDRSTRIVRGTLAAHEPQGLLVGHPDGSGHDYGHPVYYSGSLDPVYTIRCVRWVATCEVHGRQVRIPAEALPASGSDAHMAVIDPRSRWEYDLWEVRTVPLPPFGGRITIGHGGRTRWGTANSTGLGSNATAAHFALDAGVIRAEEWAHATAVSGAIEHALFMSVRCTAGRSVYPAAPEATGTVCDRKRNRAPALGARYYLKMKDGQIDALPVPAWKRPILKAMAHYGMIVGDTFGGDRHAFGLGAESDTQYTAFGHPGRYRQLGEAWGVPTYAGAHVFDIGTGVNWRDRLRVVRPCVSRGDC